VRRLPSDFFSDKAIFRRNPDGFQEKATQSEGKDGGKMCMGIYSVVPYVLQQQIKEQRQDAGDDAA
jgi:hypothetical protein